MTLVDERFVPQTSPRSNAALVRSTADAGQGGLRAVRRALSPRPTTRRAAAGEASSELSRLPWPLDVAILGMGDGRPYCVVLPGRDRPRDAASPRCSRLRAAGRCRERRRAAADAAAGADRRGRRDRRSTSRAPKRRQALEAALGRTGDRLPISAVFETCGESRSRSIWAAAEEVHSHGRNVRHAARHRSDHRPHPRTLETVARDLSRPARRRGRQERQPRRRCPAATSRTALPSARPSDKAALGGDRVPNLGIITSYNDMLSAHQPFETFPALIKQAAREAGGVAQVAGGVPAMCDGVTQGQPGMELSLFSRDVIAMSAAVGLSHNMFDAAVYPRRLRQDRAGPGDRGADLRPSAGGVHSGRADDHRPAQ